MMQFDLCISRRMHFATPRFNHPIADAVGKLAHVRTGTEFLLIFLANAGGGGDETKKPNTGGGEGEMRAKKIKKNGSLPIVPLACSETKRPCLLPSPFVIFSQFIPSDISSRIRITLAVGCG